MQPLTAAPRAALSAAQVRAVLTATDLRVGYGVDLLGVDLAFVADLSPDVTACTITRDMAAAVHGGITLSVSRALAWGRDRVMPWIRLSSATAGVTNARFNLGVYLITTPGADLGEDPITYAASGFDQLYLLQADLGDSYAVPAGTNVLAAVRAALTAAGIASPVLLDSSAADAVWPAGGKVWPLTSSQSPRWLDVVNGLLDAIGYTGIWADWDGALRSGPLVDASRRPAEWTLDVGNQLTGIVADGRTVQNDVWGLPNLWTFVTTGFTSSPVEGTGQYTVQNVSSGPASQDALGRVVRAPVVTLDAVDQASLIAQGNALAAAAMRVAEVITVALSPFPAAWHRDVVTYADAALGGTRKAMCSSWSLPLDGSDMTYVMEVV